MEAIKQNENKLKDIDSITKLSIYLNNIKASLGQNKLILKNEFKILLEIGEIILSKKDDVKEEDIQDFLALYSALQSINTSYLIKTKDLHEEKTTSVSRIRESLLLHKQNLENKYKLVNQSVNISSSAYLKSDIEKALHDIEEDVYLYEIEFQFYNKDITVKVFKSIILDNFEKTKQLLANIFEIVNGLTDDTLDADMIIILNKVLDNLKLSVSCAYGILKKPNPIGISEKWEKSLSEINNLLVDYIMEENKTL